MSLTIVRGMTLNPYQCLLCSGNPVDLEGNQQKAIFAEGVDVDWGSSVYICFECGELIADLMGRATKEGFDRVTEELEALREQHAALLEEHAEQEELVEKIRAGSEAIKKVKAAT